ncbi:MAG: quinone-dependent dihydroorotate dehydrogenase [Bacteroidales bacterium]|nr:quinone-dependent dihydroorotate dehydrogenase [Bacteroidales bacterium]
MYKFIRPLLFSILPERAHILTVKLLIFLRYVPFSGMILRWLYSYSNKGLEREVFGLKFRNPIGMAAGFDKNGDIYNDLANFGFGFVEIGSLTPVEQIGNPRPRVFRIVEENAIINRMGINNKGVKHAVNYMKSNKPRLIIGGNISKSTSSGNEMAAQDYEKSFTQLYDFVDFFVLNVSCPNVKGLVKLQNITALSEIIDRLTAIRRFNDEYRPILLKVSPDLTNDQLDEIIELILISGIDGIVATNTTSTRDLLKNKNAAIEEIGDGGLSGEPLFLRSLEMVRYIHKKSAGMLPIIAVGGISTPERAKEMLDAGASLVEVYTGFIYNGPGFIKSILKYLSK